MSFSRPLRGTLKPADRNAEAAQRRAVHARDYKNGRPCCRFEKKVGRSWKECGRGDASDMAHIIPRRHCGKVSTDPTVALLACRDCHSIYDLNTLGEAAYEVRAPLRLARPAWKFVVANTKTPPPARYNPDA